MNCHKIGYKSRAQAIRLGTSRHPRKGRETKLHPYLCRCGSGM